MRVQSGDMTHEEQQALAAWLKADLANAESFARLQKLAHFGMRLRDYPHLIDNLPGYVDWKRNRHTSRMRRWQLWGSAIATAAVCSTVVAISLPALFASNDSGERYQTKHGELRQIGLVDGSRIAVNTDSDVSVKFSADERRVVLSRGEVFFDVAKDKHRPFIVNVGNREIRVLGTRFTVRIANGQTSVVVTEGKVNVAPNSSRADAPRHVLQRGDMIQFNPGSSNDAAISQTDPEAVTAWLVGDLVFEDETLINIVAEMNRYTTRSLHINNDDLKQIRLTGRFRVGDVDGILFALKERLDVDARIEGERIVLVK